MTTRWQQYVLDVAGERVDGPGSPYAYSDVTAIIGRRCGKTVTTMGVPLGRSLMGPITLDNGRVLPFRGAHTAQNLVKARQRFMKDLVEPFQASMSPSVWRAGQNLRSSISDTALTIDPAVAGKDWRLPRASTIQVFAPTRSSVRGDGIAHLTFDEALVFTVAQGDDLLAAAGPTMGDLRGHGQMWAISNVTMLNDSKTWLAKLRDRGRAAIDSGGSSGVAHFEFTIPEDADPTDPAVWWDYYPALADGIIREEELHADLARLGVESFAAEYLGRWPGEGAVLAWSAIARGDWEDVVTDQEQPEDARVVLGVDIDPFGRSASIVAGVMGADGDPLLELIDHRPGSTWVADAVRQLAPNVGAIVIDDYGPGHDLLAALAGDENTQLQDRLHPTKSTDFSAACYLFDAAIRERNIHIRRSTFYPTLTGAASAAARTSGKSWQWERRVNLSQSPVVACTLAAWALGRVPDTPDFFVY